MAVEFVYTLEDVEKEFKELLDSTAGFGRSDANFTPEEYDFRIGQLASCVKQLKPANQQMEEAIEFAGKNKDKFGKFDPRYESRFTANETFEMDWMLQEIIQEYRLNDDEFSHFVLFQALKQLNGDKPDDFEILIYKEDAVETRNNFDYLKNDFDYVELRFNDDGMADYAERFYNDGENNIAVFSRKAFEEYLCDAIIGKFPLVLDRAEGSGSVRGAEKQVLLNLLGAIPDIKMKHSGRLVETIEGLVDGLEFYPIHSFNIRDMAANGFYAKWMNNYLRDDEGLRWLVNAIEDAGMKQDYSGMSSRLQKVHRRLLENEYFNSVEAFIKFTGVMPGKDLMRKFYRAWLDDERFKRVAWGMEISGVTPDKETMFPFYKYWLNSEYLGYFKNGMEVSGIKPDENLMAEFYEKWLRDGEYGHIERAEKITGIKPDYNHMKGLIKQKYESMLYFEEFGAASRFAQRTHTKPPEDSMFMYYRHWLKNDELGNVERGIKLSGIKPAAELMSGFYTKCLKNHNIGPFERAITITGVRPDLNAILEDMNECYMVWIEEGRFDEAERGIKLTGIKPDYASMVEQVQKGYKAMLYDRNFRDAAKCAKASGIKPDSEVMSKFYESALESGDFYGVADGIKLSGIQPDYSELEEAVKSGYVMRMIFGGSKDIERGFQLTGIKPQGYVTAVCRLKDRILGFFGMGHKTEGMEG